MKLEKCVEIFDRLYPREFCAEWDFPGLTFGDMDAKISKVVYSVDITPAVIDFAADCRADLLFTHHPLFFRGEHLFGSDTFRGEMISKMAKNGIAHFNAHTNADSAPNGVADSLAKLLGLRDIAPLVQSDFTSTQEQFGLGRVGNFETQKTLSETAAFLQKTLNEKSVVQNCKRGILFCGDENAQIKRVALLPGAGDGEFAAARASGADVFITSDLRHHVAQDQISLNSQRGVKTLNLIDAPHSQIEGVWFENMIKDFNNACEKLGENPPEFIACSLNTDVFSPIF